MVSKSEIKEDSSEIAYRVLVGRPEGKELL
jgi:hypothetical protein